MVGNTDNAITYYALKNLYTQATKICPNQFGDKLWKITFKQFYLDVIYGDNRIGPHSNFRVRQIEGKKRQIEGKEDPNKGKLILEQLAETCEWKPITDPVDCYNLIRPGESLAEAVARLY